MQKDLVEKLKSKQAAIGVVGLGYVGLPLALRFSEVGFRVVGIDIDPEKVEKLGRGQSYIQHISPGQIRHALEAGLTCTTDFSKASELEALIICVPTPLNAYREPDLSYIVNTAKSLAPHLRKGQVLSLESTTYPGTTEEVLLPIVAAGGKAGALEIGRDLFLVFSPEREDPGNPDFSTRTIPKVVGGVTSHCLEVGVALYGMAVDTVVPMSSTRAAEMTKLLENIHRSVNIGLVNEMKIVCDRMGIDIYEVIKAAATKPFGFTAYYPGPGLGGHCIPVDPFYLTWKAREYGLHTRFIELAGEINSGMPQWVLGKLTDALNQRSRALKGSRILVLGLAYKKNVDDSRESPSVEMMKLLLEKGAVVSYSDPHVPVFPKMRRYKLDLKSVELTPSLLKSVDCVLVATNHDAFDYLMVKENAPLIVDTRGVYREAADHIVKA